MKGAYVRHPVMPLAGKKGPVCDVWGSEAEALEPGKSHRTEARHCLPMKSRVASASHPKRFVFWGD